MEPIDSASESKIEYLRRWAMGKTALDLGCGAGWYANWLAEHGYTVTALDHETVSLAPGVRFEKCDLEKNWPVSGAFDTVVAFDVMEHVADEKLFLSQLAGSTAKRLILSVPQTDPGHFRPFNLAYFHYTDRTHQRTYEKAELREKLERAGFRLVSLKEEGPVFPHVVGLFARWCWFGWLLKKTMGLFLKLGLLHTPYYADLFVIADKKT